MRKEHLMRKDETFGIASHTQENKMKDSDLFLAIQVSKDKAMLSYLTFYLSPMSKFSSSNRNKTRIKMSERALVYLTGQIIHFI